MNPTDEQSAIFHHAHTTNESLIIEALAGTGKTSALIECIKLLPQPTSLVLAFNKRIAEEMTRRLPKLPRTRIAHVKTLNAAGFWMLREKYPSLKVTPEVTEERIRSAAGKGAPLRVLGAATKLLRLVKDFQHEPKLNLDFAYVLGVEFDVFAKLRGGAETQRVVETVEKAYQASLDIKDAVDFPDQGWLPLVLGIDPPYRYKAILLDEAQDINANQLAMVEQLLAPKGRIIAAGDLNQQIYSWRGAVGLEVWKRLRDQHNAKSFPLTVTWRCCQSVVHQANELVPTLRARPGASDGEVRIVSEASFYDAIHEEEAESVFVLSRANAELLRVALEMWRRQIAFNITQSTDMLYPLKGVLQRILRGDVPPKPKELADKDSSIEHALGLFHLRQQRGQEQAAQARKVALEGESGMPILNGLGVAGAAQLAFKQTLSAWYMTEMIKAQESGSTSWAERIDEQHRMLLYCLNYVRDPREIEELLDNIYVVDDTCWITLSTVHKIKGMEADSVFLLRQTFQRYQERRDRGGNLISPTQEELNIEYVAITRARRALTWIDLDYAD